MIFKVLGTPEPDDISFITDQKALDYFKSFKPTKRMDFRKKFPGASEDQLDLLNKMLQINPFYRISVQSAL